MARPTIIDLAYDALAGGDRTWRVQQVTEHCCQNPAYCRRVFAYLHPQRDVLQDCTDAARFGELMQGRSAKRYAAKFVDVYDAAKKVQTKKALKALDKVAQELPSLDAVAANLDAVATGLCKAIASDNSAESQRELKKSIDAIFLTGKIVAKTSVKVIPHAKTVVRYMQQDEVLWPYQTRQQ